MDNSIKAKIKRAEKSARKVYATLEVKIGRSGNCKGLLNIVDDVVIEFGGEDEFMAVGVMASI